MKTQQSTFAREVEYVETCAAWGMELTREQVAELNTVLQRTATLLADIGLSPDVKYSVEDVSRLKTAILCAIGGAR